MAVDVCQVDSANTRVPGKELTTTKTIIVKGKARLPTAMKEGVRPIVFWPFSEF